MILSDHIIPHMHATTYHLSNSFKYIQPNLILKGCMIYWNVQRI